MEKVKRNRQIVKLRNKGLTYQAVGRKFIGPNGKPLTRQAVEQIYHRDIDKYPTLKERVRRWLGRNK